MSEPKKCSYIDTNGIQCQRPAEHYNQCMFHNRERTRHKIGIDQFKVALDKLIQNEDYNWNGFIFPIEITIEDTTFTKPVNAEGATFSENVIFNTCEFQGGLNISDSTFNAGFSFRLCTFGIGGLSALYCIFHKNFSLSGRFYGQANFSNSVFHENVNFHSNRITHHSFVGAAHKSTVFTPFLSVNDGLPVSLISKIKKVFIATYRKVKNLVQRAIYNSTKYLQHKILVLFSKMKRFRKRFPYEQRGLELFKPFEAGLNLYGVIFNAPEKVIFREVDLRRAIFDNVLLTNVRFLDCEWYQSTLKRNGLYEDARLQRFDYFGRQHQLPIVENTYRQIRLLLEDVKDYNRASDFFIGEKLCALRQLSFFKKYFFSVLAWYRYLSNFGTSPFRCLLWILLALNFHIHIFYPATSTTDCDQNNSPPSIICESSSLENSKTNFQMAMKRYSLSAVYSFEVLTHQRDTIIKPKPNTAFLRFINIAFTIFTTILIALFGLAVRTRIKRN